MPKPLPMIEVRPVAECTPSLVAAPMTAEHAEVLAARLKALADPTRLRLLSILLSAEGGATCTCDLIDPLGLSQPTVTHHLRTLVAAGLVEGERRGTWTFYSVVSGALTELAGLITPG